MSGQFRGGLGIAAGVFVLDQLSKAFALEHLELAVELLPFLTLVLHKNTGVSFGMLSGTPAWLLSALSLAVTAVLLVWLWRANERLLALSLGLITGGATGNVVDRLRAGAVTDFLDLHFRDYHWPAFNLADVAIVCGVGILLLASIKPAKAASDERL